jgi:hypothetical protein
MMMQLIALKPFKYATRALKSGDLFHARQSDARVLTALKKAREVRAPTKIAAPPKKIVQRIQQSEGASPDVEKLRADAEAVGIKTDLRWGPKRLQAEIDKALA